MNKYEKYAFRQLILNQLYPPSEQNKIFGNKFLFDALNAYLFFNMGQPKQKSTNQGSNTSDNKSQQEIDEAERQKNIEKYKKLREFTLKKTNNPFIMSAQLFNKLVFGFVIICFRLMGIKMEKQDL